MGTTTDSGRPEHSCPPNEQQQVERGQPDRVGDEEVDRQQLVCVFQTTLRHDRPQRSGPPAGLGNGAPVGGSGGGQYRARWTSLPRRRDCCWRWSRFSMRAPVLSEGVSEGGHEGFEEFDHPGQDPAIVTIGRHRRLATTGP
jgi:hypothetical protein